MAARSVRRSFASPFVVTLAAALPTACYVQPGPPVRSSGGGGGGSPQVTTDENAPNHTNPPRPTGETVPNQQTPDHSTTNAGAEQAPAGGGKTVVIANPPRPAPAPVAKQDRRWTVTKASGTCSAYSNSTCPEPPAGQPRPSCNPPPPMKYACPAVMTENMITVVQFAGQKDCQIEYPPIKCPPNAMCNPPPPQKVACPQ